jgi:hypothetical protein
MLGIVPTSFPSAIAVDVIGTIEEFIPSSWEAIQELRTGEAPNLPEQLKVRLVSDDPADPVDPDDLVDPIDPVDPPDVWVDVEWPVIFDDIDNGIIIFVADPNGRYDIAPTALPLPTITVTIIAIDVSGEIIAFEPLDDDTKHQDVPYDTPESSLNIPSELLATVEFTDVSDPTYTFTQSIFLEVSWLSSYDGTTSGLHGFDLDVDAFIELSIRNGIPLPRITVEVGQRPTPVIFGFAPLDSSIAFQDYVVGELFSEVYITQRLWDELDELIAETSDGIKRIPVTAWTSTPTFDPNVAGTYQYIPTLNFTGYELLPDIEPPVVTVIVRTAALPNPADIYKKYEDDFISTYAPHVYTSISQVVAAPITAEYVLVNLSNTITQSSAALGNRTITVPPTVKIIKFEGGSRSFTGLNIEVLGTTEVVFSDFTYTGYATNPATSALAFYGADATPKLISLGKGNRITGNNDPIITETTTPNGQFTNTTPIYAQYAVYANSNLTICGNANLSIAGANGKVYEHITRNSSNGTETRINLNTPGQHAIRVNGRFDIDLYRTTLTIRGGNGRNGENGEDHRWHTGGTGTHGSNNNASNGGRPGGNGENGGMGAIGLNGGNGTNGSPGGDGIESQGSINILNASIVNIYGGDGGAGGNGGWAGHGGNGGRGGNGASAWIANHGGDGGWGGPGAPGGIGGIGGDGGSGGSPVVIAGSIANFNYRTSPFCAVYLQAGRGRNAGTGGRGGNGGDGGGGGTRGTSAGVFWSNGSNGSQGEGGVGGAAGQSGNAGINGSLNVVGKFSRSNISGSIFYGGTSSATSGGSGGWGRTGRVASGASRGAGASYSSAANSEMSFNLLAMGITSIEFVDIVEPIIPADDIIVRITARADERRETWLTDIHDSLYQSLIPTSDKEALLRLFNGHHMEPVTILDVSHIRDFNEDRNTDLAVPRDTSWKTDKSGVRYQNFYPHPVGHANANLRDGRIDEHGTRYWEHSFTLTFENPINTTQGEYRDDVITAVVDAFGCPVVARKENCGCLPMVGTQYRCNCAFGCENSACIAACKDDDRLLLAYSFDQSHYDNLLVTWVEQGGITLNEKPNVMYFTGGKKTFTATIGRYCSEHGYVTEGANGRCPLPCGRELGSRPTFQNRDRLWYVSVDGSPEVLKGIGHRFKFNPHQYSDYIGKEITITVYPMDRRYRNPDDSAKDSITFVLSDEIPRVIEITPWQRYVTGFDGDPIRVNFESPAHDSFMTAGNYSVQIWEYEPGKDSPADYLGPPPRIPGQPPIIPSLIPGLTSSDNFIDIDSSLLSGGLSKQDSDRPGWLVPKYFVYVSYIDDGVELGDFVYLVIMPAPLRVRFNNKESYSFIHTGVPIPFSWAATGSDITSYSVDVRGPGISGYPKPRNEGNYVFAAPLPSVFRETYRMSVTVRNIHGDTAVDTLTFDVYNPDKYTLDSSLPLANERRMPDGNTWAADLVLDNNAWIAGLPSDRRARSEAILARNREIDLHSMVRITDGELMHIMDSSVWSSDNNSSSSVNNKVGNLWYDVESLSALSYHPAREFMVIGHADGMARVTSTHPRTNLTAYIDVDVTTLRNKLYLITAIPALPTDITYTNGNGDTFTLRTNDKGEIAIYEPDGIVGEVLLNSREVKMENGVEVEDLFLGSIDSSKLQSGETNPGLLELYPLNRVRLRRMTSLVFFPYLPNGNSYTGRVSIRGGLNKNGVFVDESRLGRPEADFITMQATGGMFRIRMDSTKFGDFGAGDVLRFDFEVEFLDPDPVSGLRFAPRLITMGGLAFDNDYIKLGDAVMHLKTWDGEGFQAVQYLFDDLDVTNNSYVGPSNDVASGVLYSRIVTLTPLDAAKMKYLDERNNEPSGPDARLINSELPFLSGNYNYWSKDLTVDGNLIRTGESRRYLIIAQDGNGKSYTIEMPFELFNGNGLVIPSELLEFDFDISGITTDTSKTTDSASENKGGGDSGIIDKLLANIMPSGEMAPESLPFKITFEPKDGNPLVYEIKGSYTFEKSFSKEWEKKEKKEQEAPQQYVWYCENAGNIGGYKHRIHLVNYDECWGLRETIYHIDNYKSAIENPNFGNRRRTVRDTIEVATGPKSETPINGYFRGGASKIWCKICSKSEIDKQKQDFDKAKEEVTDAKKGKAKSEHKATLDGKVKIVAYFEAELGYDLHTQEFVRDITELGILFSGNLDFAYTAKIPIPAPPIPPGVLNLLIEFKAGVGLSVEARVYPKNIYTGQDKSEWFTLEAKTNGYVRLRGALGIDIWIAAADIGAFAELGLSAEFISQIFAGRSAARYKVDATIGIDANLRIGPKMSIFGIKLYYNWYWVIWKKTWSTGYKPIGSGDQSMFSSNSPAPTSSPMTFSMMGASFSPLIFDDDTPSEMLPSDDPVFAGNNNFAVAAWTSTRLTEDDIEALEDRYEGNTVGDELIEGYNADDMVGVTSLTEITVAVQKNGKWLESETLTDNMIADFNPRVAVSGDKAVVTWQQVVLRTIDGIIDYASIEFWYSVYDGSKWLPAERINASINEFVGDYAVALNGSNIGLIYTEGYIHNRDGVDVLVDNIYVIHINGAGLATHNKVTTDISVNANPQISVSGGGFLFSYYTDDLAGNDDIVLGKLMGDGYVDHDYKHSIAAVASIVGLTPSFNYTLINDSNGTAIAWTVYDIEADGYDIYTVKLVNDTFIAPTKLSQNGSIDNSILTLSSGTIGADGTVSVLYTRTDTADYLTLHEYASNQTQAFQRDVLDTMAVSGEPLSANGQFKNDYLYGMTIDDNDVMPETELPVLFSITNTGLRDITGITVKLNGYVFSTGTGAFLAEHALNNLNIPPNGTYRTILYVRLGEVITGDIKYDITVNFSDGPIPLRSDYIHIAKPDVSIAKTTVLNGERGRRDFSINLYNKSGVRLRGSGNRVRVSFYDDPMHTISASGMSDVIISDPAQLGLIDEGGMSVLSTYTIDDNELNSSLEVPSEGIRLYIKAEVIDSEGNPVQEICYLESGGNVRFESLWRYGQDAVLVLADQYDSSTSIARISVQNNSFQPLHINAGNLAARLYDAAGRLIEIQVVEFTNSIPGESVFTTAIQFERTGAYVIADFENKNSIIGFIRSYNPQHAVTVQLMQGTTEIRRIVIRPEFGGGLVEQKYVFSNVDAGTYTIVVSKDTHTEFTIETVIVVEDAVNLERDQRAAVRPITMLCGDINGDGMINMDDLMILLSSSNYMRPSYLAVNPLADLNGDGMVNMDDLMILLNTNNYMKSRVVIP